MSSDSNHDYRESQEHSAHVTQIFIQRFEPFRYIVTTRNWTCFAYISIFSDWENCCFFNITFSNWINCFIIQIITSYVSVSSNWWMGFHCPHKSFSTVLYLLFLESNFSWPTHKLSVKRFTDLHSTTEAPVSDEMHLIWLKWTRPFMRTKTLRHLRICGCTPDCGPKDAPALSQIVRFMGLTKITQYYKIIQAKNFPN